ncbi:MAG: MmcQ/YjbR family DNA-binding protein [Clostridia bacterium]|nr:MmcQ/YjbR family DNA-binding protein [Clostridia bacterium]
MAKKSSLRGKIFEYAKEKYSTSPEYPWMKFPDYAILRHADGKKWYGLIMDLPKEKLGLRGKNRVDILNLKLDDMMFAEMLLGKKGYFKGYHISSGRWISVLLDGTVPFRDLAPLIDISFRATAAAGKKRALRPPKEWLIPANPRYYDVVRAFEENAEIEWKQGRGIKTGDTVYMYVGAPVSAVLYKCEVTQTDIPFEYSGGEINITALMRIKLRKKYPPDEFTFGRLCEEFGVFTVRGPRGVPRRLSAALDPDRSPVF